MLVLDVDQPILFVDAIGIAVVAVVVLELVAVAAVVAVVAAAAVVLSRSLRHAPLLSTLKMLE